jgi:lysophospholipase L1-like esterase
LTGNGLPFYKQVVKPLFAAFALIFVVGSVARGGGTIAWPVPPVPADANPAATPVAPISGWINHFANNLKKAREKSQVDVIFDGNNFALTSGWKADPGPMTARFSKLNAVDFGSMGDTTQSLLWRLQNGQVDGLHPKLIVLMVGGDNLQSNTPEEVADGIKADLAEYQKRCPDATVLLCGLLPRGGLPTDPFRAKAKAVNQLIAPLGDGKKVIYLDFGDKMLQPDGTIGRNVLGDFMHPNITGYKIWGDAIQPVIDQLIPPASTAASSDSTVAPASAAASLPIGGTLTWPAPQPGPGLNTAVVPAPNMSWLPHFQQNLDDSRKMPSVDLVFDGDSITAGWKGGGGGIWQKKYARLNGFDFGISGDSTQGLLWRLQNGELDGLHPKLIVLLIGTNNMTANSAEQIAGGIKADVEELRKRCPDATVLLQGIFPRGEKPTDPVRAKVKEVNKLVSALADGNKVLFLDFGDKLLDPQGNYTHPITQDFLHPTTPGYQIWADAIQPVVDKFFPLQTTTASAPK